MPSNALQKRCAKCLLEKTIIFGLNPCSYKRLSGDYLHQSIIPTDHFQNSLPRLPIPKLESSCTKYLNALSPILSDKDFDKSKLYVNEFLNGQGPELHKLLVETDKKNKHTSYVSGAWFDMYLKDRRPLVLNYNPFMQFADDSRPDYMNQLVRATNMIVSSVRFLNSYRKNILEPDVYHLDAKVSDTIKFKRFCKALPSFLSWYGAFWYKAFPLDMSQYVNLFNSTRIPRYGKDELFRDCSARHILVIHRGHHFYFDVYDEKGLIVPGNRIMENLRYIISLNLKPAFHSIGYLTADNRDIWAKMRDKMNNNGNCGSLYMVDSALFALILEDEQITDPNQGTKFFLFGNGANRWYDKSFSLILDTKGVAALNFEHSWGDGVAVLRYFNEIYKDSIENLVVHPNTRSEHDASKDVKHIDWILDDEIKNEINLSKSRYQESTSKLDCSYVQYSKFGKKFLKGHKISPDSFMQLSFIMAYYRLFGSIPATYESCSTAAFKHGRTETIRSATIETKKACELFQSASSNNNEKKEAILACTKVHNKLTKDAAMGQGFDRHMLTLKRMAEAKGMNCSIFEDKAYSNLNHIILSTSTLSSPALRFGGFAPVTPDGYGIGYTAESDFLGANITVYNPEKDVHKFIQSLKSCFNDMYKVLDETDSNKNE